MPTHRPLSVNSGTTLPTFHFCPPRMPTSKLPPFSLLTSCYAPANSISCAAVTSTFPPNQCGAPLTKACASHTCAHRNRTFGKSLSPSTPTDHPINVSFSAPPASIPPCLGPSPKRRFRRALLGTPYGEVVLLHARTEGNPLTPSVDLAAGVQSRRLRTTFFRGATFHSATGALLNLTRLLQPPPVSQLNSRIRSNAVHLPDAPFTTNVAIAMLDLIHDRLQAVSPHRSDWPMLRPIVVRFILEGDIVDFADYYDPMTGTVVTRLEWKDLHPGLLTISTEVVDSVLQNVGSARLSSNHIVQATSVSEAMDACVRNLQHEGIITAAPCPLPSTMSLFLKPKDEHSARVICDLRPLNGLYSTDPPSFSLPSISALVSTTRWWSTCCFTKLDITAYFHSLGLKPDDLRRLCPPDMPTHPFVFHYRNQCWMWMRLPFGWSWAPALAQRQMQNLVNTALLAFPDVLGLVYYDDVLMASPDNGRLELATKHLVDYLRQQGLHVSDHKCVLTPAREIDWIGKRVGQRSVSNNSARARQLAGVLVALSRCRSVRLLRRLLGWISWYSSHFPGANRALGPAYALLRQNVHAGLPWNVLWSFCLTLALGLGHVQWCADSDSGLSIIYTDAAAYNETIGICDCTGAQGTTIQVPRALIQPYGKAADAQQVAELYGVAVAITAASLENRGAIMFTDNKACEAWFAGEKIPVTNDQSNLLLAASIFRTLHSVDFHVRWIPGALNPADPWSRRSLNRARDEGLL